MQIREHATEENASRRKAITNKKGSGWLKGDRQGHWWNTRLQLAQLHETFSIHNTESKLHTGLHPSCHRSQRGHQSLPGLPWRGKAWEARIVSQLHQQLCAYPMPVSTTSWRSAAWRLHEFSMPALQQITVRLIDQPKSDRTMSERITLEGYGGVHTYT